MKIFLMLVLFLIAIFNFFLGYSGSILSREVNRVVIHHGVDIPALTFMAFTIQPGFYFLACLVLVSAVLGLMKKLSERLAVYLVVLFMFMDIVGLLISAWGFGMVHFLM